MGRSKVEDSVILARMTCIKPVLIYGRKGTDIVELCFEEGKEYLFCYDVIKDQVFTQNEVREMHFLDIFSQYTINHFDSDNIETGSAEQLGLSEFEAAKYTKMFRVKHSYSEE